MATINAQAIWDDAAKVWIATSDDIPGLVPEAKTVESPVVKLRTVIPELLEAKGQPVSKRIPFALHSELMAVAG